MLVVGGGWLVIPKENASSHTQMDLSSEDEVLKVNRFGSDHISGGKSWATARSWEASVFFSNKSTGNRYGCFQKYGKTPKSSICS